MELGGIRTVLAVNLYSAAGSDEAKHLVAIYRLAATGKLEVDALKVLVDDEHIVVGRLVDNILTGLDVKSVGALRHIVADDVLVFLLQFKIFLYDGIHVERAVNDLLVEVANLLELQLLDKSSHDRLLDVDFLVLKLPFDNLLGILTLLHLRLFQGKADLRLGTRGLHHIEPVLLGFLYA